MDVEFLKPAVAGCKSWFTRLANQSRGEKVLCTDLPIGGEVTMLLRIPRNLIVASSAWLEMTEQGHMKSQLSFKQDRQRASASVMLSCSQDLHAVHVNACSRARRRDQSPQSDSIMT